MFDLEKSIADWKRSFQQNCSLAEEKIEELESHLRESIIDLGRKGLNEEQGFLVATKRLGHAAVLGAEYEMNGYLGANSDRLIWMLSGYLGITLCGMCSTAFVSVVSTGMAVVGAGATTTGIVATLVQLIFWITLFVVACRVDQAFFVFGRFPKTSLTAMFAAMIILPFISPLVTSAQARTVEPTWLVETYYWVGFGHFTIQLFIYAFCFVVLHNVRKSRIRLAE